MSRSHADVVCCFWPDLLNGVHQPDDVYMLSLHRGAECDADEYSTTYDPKGEVNGTGYTAGGKQLTGRRVEYEAKRHGGTLLFDPPHWPRATITGVDLIQVYNKSKGNRLIGVQRLDRPYSSTNGPFTITAPIAFDIGEAKGK